MTSAHFDSGRDHVRDLARVLPVWTGGPGATPDFAAATDTHLLDTDPLTAADRVTAAQTA